MSVNLPNTDKKRVIIVGGGFGGLRVARKLVNAPYQVVLFDRHNYHQFQPLFYQVATAGLEPSSISFPFRRVFQHAKNVHFRNTAVQSIDPKEKLVETGFGPVKYDCLVLAQGANTNFFGMDSIQKHAIPMKSIPEALYLRNTILQHFENALAETDEGRIEDLMNIVVVGGGPTGVEVSGTLAEMKKAILPKDYPELDFSKMSISLIEGADRLLLGMSDEAGQKAEKYLQRLGVKVRLNAMVKNYDGLNVQFGKNGHLQTKMLIWAAGITGNKLPGLPDKAWVKGNRLAVNRFNQLVDDEAVFAIGDIAYMEEPGYPKGHPQVAQVAIQQADNVTKNLLNLSKQKPLVKFSYKDLGSMATVGRNLAVVDLPYAKFQGFFAWIFWLAVHLMQIVGVKNKLFIFINWFWNYVTYDQSLRLIIKPKTNFTAEQ